MAVNPDELFSQEALEKLRSPEQLDKMLPIVTPAIWMSLIAIIILTISVLVWSVYGAFTTKVMGSAMLMDVGGLASVSHIGDGEVTEILVNKNTHVTKGQLLATITQPATEAGVRSSRYSVDQSANQREARSRVNDYDTKIYQNTMQENVYSSVDGIVDDILIAEGDYISSGMPLFTIRRTQNNDNLTGVAYMPADQAKKIATNMDIQLVPSGVSPDKNGYLLGKVRSVSQYPVSEYEIRHTLGNATLAQGIMAQLKVPLVEVKFDLIEDKDDSSRYLWTAVGDHKPITAGTYCSQASVVVERTPPIQKAFYKLVTWIRNG